MTSISFKVQERNIKANQKNLRKVGQIPGVIYGEFLDNTISIKMCNAELRRMLRKNNSGSIIQVELDDKKYNCVVKEVQRNHLQEILHVDFQYAKPNEIIKMRIPIRCVGQENLESKRLILETHNLYLDLQGSVEKIPEFIEVNVADMKFEDKLFVEDIAIPEDVIVITDPKILLAVVNG